MTNEEYIRKTVLNQIDKEIDEYRAMVFSLSRTLHRRAEAINRNANELANSEVVDEGFYQEMMQKSGQVHQLATDLMAAFKEGK